MAAAARNPAASLMVVPRQRNWGHWVDQMPEFTTEPEDDTWKAIMSLPAVFTNKPMSKPLSASAPVLPLEELVPMFIFYFIADFQSIMLHLCNPIHGLNRQMIDGQDTYTLVTHGRHGKAPSVPSQGTISCQNWLAHGFERNITAQDAQDRLNAYAMLSMRAKCTQVVISFGLFIHSTLETHQMTYQNERIIGWAVQDGVIDLTRKDLTASVRVLDIADLSTLPQTLQAIQDGIQNPSGTQSMSIGRNEIHVWLTFVTESGRIFDMDLSALQFKPQTSILSCIFPVLSAEPTAFDGLCRRSALLGIEPGESLLGIIANLATEQVKFSQMSSGHTGPLAPEGELETIMFHQFLGMKDTMLKAMPDALDDFKSEQYFWDLMRFVNF